MLNKQKTCFATSVADRGKGISIGINWTEPYVWCFIFVTGSLNKILFIF